MQIYVIFVLVLSCNVSTSHLGTYDLRESRESRERRELTVPRSPCSELFNYVQDGDSWVGVVKVQPPSDTSPGTRVVTVNLNFTLPEFIKSSNIGFIELHEDSKKLAKRLIEGDFKPIEYRIRFPVTKFFLPVLRNLQINDETVCWHYEEESPAYIAVSTISLHHKLTLTFNPAVTYHVTHSSRYPVNSATFRPLVPQSTFRPSIPQSTFRPFITQSIFRPLIPQSTFRPSIPQSTFRPLVPQSTFRPLVPQSTFRPLVPQSTFRPLETTSSPSAVQPDHQIETQITSTLSPTNIVFENNSPETTKIMFPDSTWTKTPNQLPTTNIGETTTIRNSNSRPQSHPTSDIIQIIIKSLHNISKLIPTKL